jgi:ferrochelatase
VAHDHPRIGLIFLGLGVPDGPAGIRPFLAEQLADPEFRRLAVPAVQRHLGGWLAGARARRLAEMAARADAPRLLALARVQMESVVGELEVRAIRRGEVLRQRAALGTRYARPRIFQAVSDLLDYMPTHLVAVPLYPHDSRALRGTCLKELERTLAERGAKAPPLLVVEPWFDSPAYLEALARRAGEALASLPAASRAAATMLFVAFYPAPNPRDAFPAQLARTAAGVVERLASPIPHRIGTLVREGRAGLDPADRALTEAARAGARAVVLVPIGGMLDDIETVVAVDVELAAKAAELGLVVARAPSFNIERDGILLLADLVEARLRAAGLGGGELRPDWAERTGAKLAGTPTRVAAPARP